VARSKVVVISITVTDIIIISSAVDEAFNSVNFVQVFLRVTMRPRQQASGHA